MWDIDSSGDECEKKVEVIEACYLLLLKISPDDPLRINNQELYARCRDAICEWSGADPEYAQDYFERMARETS